MDAFVRYLEERLSHPLPGLEAQRKMEPRPVDGQERPHRASPSDAIQSGVMLLFYPQQKQEHQIILTVRSDHIEQGGQICFPGGRAHSSETPLETALRETEEEIGVRPDLIQHLGTLTPLYVYGSNSQIYPSVGYLDDRPQFVPDRREVQEIFTIGIDQLISRHNFKTERWKLRDRSFIVPFWDIHSVPLWGATAMVLAEFLQLYCSFYDRSLHLFKE